MAEPADVSCGWYPPHVLGRRGEDLAVRWYEQHGYEILARNWSCLGGEIDIVAATGRLVVFCEVKSRSSLSFGSPAEAVGPAKQARLRRLAAWWFAQRGPYVVPGASVRFDVACVLGAQLEMLEGAF